MAYWIDTHEQDLIAEMGGSMMISTVPAFAVRPLPIADIWIGTTEQGIAENGIVIERKTVRDLEASIMDGRYREQRGRILAFCQEHKVQPVYLIEGAWNPRTLPKSTLIKHIHRMALHYQIPVLQTASLEDTAERIRILVDQWKEDPTALQRTTELIKVSDGIHVQKKANAADPRQFATASLAQCTGVSVKMAEALLDTFGSLRAIMDCDPKEIEAVKVGARRVGPAVAARLHELLNA